MPEDWGAPEHELPGELRDPETSPGLKVNSPQDFHHTDADTATQT